MAELPPSSRKIVENPPQSSKIQESRVLFERVFTWKIMENNLTLFAREKSYVNQKNNVFCMKFDRHCYFLYESGKFKKKMETSIAVK